MKRTIALFLSLMMLASSMAVGVFATDELSPAADADTVAAEAQAEDTDAVIEDTDNAAPEVSEEAAAPEDEVLPEEEPALEAANGAVSTQEAANEGETTTGEEPAPETPFSASVTAEATGATSATVRWTYSGAAEKVTVNGAAADLAAGQYVVNGLAPASTQKFTVVFSKNDGTVLGTYETGMITLPVDTVKGLKAYSAYKSVALEWKPVPGAVSYNVYRNGKRVKTGVKSRAYDNKNMMSYIDKTGDESEKKYSYKVSAVTADGREGPHSAAVKKASVTQLYITVTFRTTRTLTSHDKGHKTRTFPAGTKINCHSFKFGKYIFKYKGNIFYCNYTSLGGFKGNLAQDKKYSKKEAEYFVKTTGKKSDTKYMIWANLYTQRLYILKRIKGVWRVTPVKYNGVKGSTWRIASGKADTPSPAGLNFKLLRHKRIQRGVNWLTFYHSQTSLHGNVGNQDFRTLRSGGCIRNKDPQALLIYKKIPLGTRLLVY